MGTGAGVVIEKFTSSSEPKGNDGHIVVEFDRCAYCRKKTFGDNVYYNNKEIMTCEQVPLIRHAGKDDIDDCAMVAAIWAKESKFLEKPDGDAGPAQLTTWWKRHHPELIVGNAYGTWHGRTKQVWFDGNVQDNLDTLGNIVRFSRNRYKSARLIPYWYGPGPDDSNRSGYAEEVMGLYKKYQEFFSCILKP